jgi:hypothetical protein
VVRFARSQRILERLAREAETGAYRAERALHGISDLLAAHPFEFEHDEDRPLLGREPSEQGIELPQLIAS